MTFLIYLTLLTTAVITQVRLSMWVYLKIKSTCDSKSALKLWTESEQQTLLHWNKLILMSQQQILLYFISVMFKVIKKRERMREKKRKRTQ